LNRNTPPSKAQGRVLDWPAELGALWKHARVQPTVVERDDNAIRVTVLRGHCKVSPSSLWERLGKQRGEAALG
jgi:hypothetical protein